MISLKRFYQPLSVIWNHWVASKSADYSRVFSTTCSKPAEYSREFTVENIVQGKTSY